MGVGDAVYLGLFEQNASVERIRYHQAESGSMGSNLVVGGILLEMGVRISEILSI